MRGFRLALLLFVVVGCHGVIPQTYLPARHNWAFRARYPEVDRLFNAFDYGHAIISELFVTRPATAGRELDGTQLTFITTKLLRYPPDVPLDAAAIAPEYTKLAPEIEQMFDWAHMLHRQVYDVLADERIPDARRQLEIDRLLRYYRGRRDLAFSALPKSMLLMEGQSYSGTFRRTAPRFNALIWSYHWLQIGVYDALLAGRSREERRALVTQVRDRFNAMVADSGANPTVMPMSAVVAPRFSTRYPELAIIFDNLHSMHDVVSDILASTGTLADKRNLLLVAAQRYRDDSTLVTSRDEWLTMSRDMGVDRMGGVAIP